MHHLALIFALHFGGPEHPGGDRWISADKAKHFFAAAFVESVSFGGLRTVGLSRGQALTGATVTAAGVSGWKELYDRSHGGTPSLKDLTWDAAGMGAAAALLNRTER